MLINGLYRSTTRRFVCQSPISRFCISKLLSSTTSITPSIDLPLPPKSDFSNPEHFRFWTRVLTMNYPSNSIDVEVVTSELKLALAIENIDIIRMQTGLAMIQSLGLMIPIHDGVIQTQHVQYIPSLVTSKNVDLNNNSTLPIANNTIDVQFYGFSPRAKHVCVSPSEEERFIDPDRVYTLNKALEIISISAEELLSENMAGTPPSRIYRSFVSPRLKAVHIIEPLERAANRTATQIELALRQVRADRASYLRNVDKSSVPILLNQSERKLNPVVLVLDNVRSAFNVGSMFRTAETAGVAELVTCGITAHPPHPKLRKTALNSVEIVPSRHFDDIMQALETLKAEGYQIVAMETTSKSVEYSKVKYPKKVALVLGNEVTGVDTRVMDVADLIVEIPTYGVKNSLNVASAAPVVLFEVLRQWNS